MTTVDDTDPPPTRRTLKFERRACVACILVALGACGTASNDDTAGAVAALNQRVTAVEIKTSQLEASRAAPGDWVLWFQEDVGSNSAYPTAQSAYPSKQECLASASRYTVPNGNLVSQDPYIIQTKSGQFVYRCLPKGVDPFRH